MRFTLIALAIIAALVTGVHFGWEAIMDTTSPFADFWNPFGKIIFTIMAGMAGVYCFGYFSGQGWMMLLFGRTFRDNANAPKELYKTEHYDGTGGYYDRIHDAREDKQMWGFGLAMFTTLAAILIVAIGGLKASVFCGTLWVAFMLIGCVRRHFAQKEA